MTGTAIISALAVWGAGWFINTRLANSAAARGRLVRLLVPAIFGLTLLIMWELLVRLLEVSPIILPPPTAIASRFSEEMPILWADFHQTIIKGALTGYIIGAMAAFGVAILADRSEFLTRGIMPVGGFMAALPIVGTAPIFVKWLGSDWESKAAVVAVMVFFPILVNTVAGLRDTTAMQRDLMEGRPSELENFNGYIVQQGLELGIHTPTNSFIYHCLLPQEKQARKKLSQ